MYTTRTQHDYNDETTIKQQYDNNSYNNNTTRVQQCYNQNTQQKLQ